MPSFHSLGADYADFTDKLFPFEDKTEIMNPGNPRNPRQKIGMASF